MPYNASLVFTSKYVEPGETRSPLRYLGRYPNNPALVLLCKLLSKSTEIFIRAFSAGLQEAVLTVQYSSGLAQLFWDPINNTDRPRGSCGQTEVRALLSRKHEAHPMDGPNHWVVFAGQGAQSNTRDTWLGYL